MGQIFTVLDALKTSLETLAELENCTITVDRQKDIDVEVRKAVSKAGGFALVIGAAKFDNDQIQLPVPRLATTIRLELVFKPVISDQDNKAADDVLEAVIKHVHHLNLSASKTRCHQFEVITAQLVDNRTYLIYVIDVKTIVQLSA